MKKIIQTISKLLKKFNTSSPPEKTTTNINIKINVNTADQKSTWQKEVNK